jgi:hypothetical protein
MVRSSTSIDFSEAICWRVAPPKSTASEPSSWIATKSSILPKPISASSRMMRSLVIAYRSKVDARRGRLDHLPARGPAPLAPNWLSPVLALEVAAAAWPPCPVGRYQKPCSSHRSREPSLGRTSHPLRAAQARFRCRQSTVAKYMVRRRGLPSQGWKTFIRNHAPDIAAIDLFVPTIGFKLLYAW